MRTGSFSRSLLSLLFATAVGLGASRAAYASHYALADVPTMVSAADAEKLKKANVGTTEDVLARAAKPKDRKELAKASGVSAATLTTLVHRCDLMRVKGIGPEMVLLLEAAGVKTAADLAKKDPAALTEATEKANKAKHITEKPPTQPQFEDWIGQAKQLPPLVDAK